MRVVMDRDARVTMLDAAEATPTASDVQGACFIVLYGDDLGRRLPLSRETSMTFGRAKDCTVILDDDTVSRKHARVEFRHGGFEVEDFGSTNGVLVNDAHVREHRLRDGDQLKIGRTIYKFLQSGNVEADYHETIYELMTSDGLTRAHNRRYFDQALTREWSRAVRYRRPVGLVLFDIDHFKKLNDSRGHLAGDDVLRQLAARVSNRLRREDIFARTGGEEFAVLVPEGTLEGVSFLAERMRHAVEETPFETDGAEVSITCSFGVVSVIPDGDTEARSLYERADVALYAAKAAGRNCVRS